MQHLFSIFVIILVSCAILVLYKTPEATIPHYKDLDRIRELAEKIEKSNEYICLFKYKLKPDDLSRGKLLYSIAKILNYFCSKGKDCIMSWPQYALDQERCKNYVIDENKANQINRIIEETDLITTFSLDYDDLLARLQIILKLLKELDALPPQTEKK